MEKRLVASFPADDERLQRLIGRTIMPDDPRSGAIRLKRPSGKAALAITAYPLPRSSRILAPFEAAAMVTLVDPTIRPNIRAEHWREAFDLTPREQELAVLLINGHSIESAAATRGISEATARFHLRGLFAKTDTSRQSDLMRLFARLG